MSKKEKKLLDTIETFIGTETTFTGNISTTKTIRIDGKLIGNIVESSGVVLGEHGEIEGNIQTKYIVVGGKINGNILASNSIELLNTAQVKGDLSTNLLSVTEGAIFEGKSSIFKTVEDKENKVKD